MSGGPAPSTRTIVEAILLLADEPLPASLIGEVLERPRAEVEQLLEMLAAEYAAENRGFVLRAVAGGWRLYTDPRCAPWLERFARRHTHARLTGAALEVLAIVAYRGPIARSEIAAVRGVDSDGVVATLRQRGLIEEVGRQASPGAPALFAVTQDFLERLGLGHPGELPPLAQFMPDADTVADMEAKLSPNA